MSSISFGFSKKTEKGLKTKSVIKEDEEKVEEKDYVLEVNEQAIKSTKPKDEPKGPLVIPLITKNKWKPKEEQDSDESTKDESSKDTETLESQAIKALREDAKKKIEGELEEDPLKDTLEIPLLLQNAAPKGSETDDKIDYEIRPEQSNLEEYETVPIEHFGMAMLRGMGWKEGQGIGRNNKNVAPVEATLRPKGMGLGADKSVLLQEQNKNRKRKIRPGDKTEETDELSFKKGVNCVITKKGEYYDLYATIQGVDEDNNRCVVQLALSAANVTLSQLHCKLVTSTEFDKYSRYLNKGKTDQYKQREEKNKQKYEEDNSNRSESRKHKSTSNSDYKTSSKKSKYDHPSSKNWCRAHLRVKIVDKKYRDGKYYSHKVIIEDVLPGQVLCKTDNGRVLDDLKESQLETVIPREEKSVVMIVGRSDHSGQVGEIIERDKHKERLLIQLLPDRDEILTLAFDDVCQYTGNVDHLLT